MLMFQSIPTPNLNLMGQADSPPSIFLGPADIELWQYRRRTMALLRRYARASIEVGRLPSLIGRDSFRARVTSYSMQSFEDVVIFVADMERSLDQLSDFDKKLLALNVLEAYTIPEVSRLLQCSQRTIERQLQVAIEELTRILLRCGLMERLPHLSVGSCQEE